MVSTRSLMVPVEFEFQGVPFTVEVPAGLVRDSPRTAAVLALKLARREIDGDVVVVGGRVPGKLG